jgi:hypothetical protein
MAKKSFEITTFSCFLSFSEKIRQAAKFRPKNWTPIRKKLKHRKLFGQLSIVVFLRCLDAMFLSSFFNFVILLKWQSFVKIFSQIW